MYYLSISFYYLFQDAAQTATPAHAAAAEPSGGGGSFLWLLLGLIIGIVIGLLLSKAFGKQRSDEAEAPPALTGLNLQTRPAAPARSATTRARRCPVCNSTYTDKALVYCVSDGTLLVTADGSSAVSDPAATISYPEPRGTNPPPTEAYRPNRNSR